MRKRRRGRDIMRLVAGMGYNKQGKGYNGVWG